MRARSWAILLAMGAAAGCWPPGCAKEPKPPAPKAPVLAQEPAPTLAPEERAMVDAMAALHSDLTAAMQSAPARVPKLAVVEPVLQAALRPHYERVSKLTPAYRALSKERRRELQRVLHREQETELIEFVRTVGEWTYAFDHDDDAIAQELRPLLRSLLHPWVRADAMWVFDGWSDEAVLELTEWTLTEDEMRAHMASKLAQGEWKHAAVVLEGKPFTVTESTNCMTCHAEGEDDDERRGDER